MEAIQDRRPDRLPASAALALALHAVLALAFALLGNIAPEPPEPISVTLETVVPLVEAPQRVVAERAPVPSPPAPPQPAVESTGAAPAAVAPPAPAPATPRATSREALREAMRSLPSQSGAQSSTTTRSPELPQTTTPRPDNLAQPDFRPNADAGQAQPGAAPAQAAAPTQQRPTLNYRDLDRNLALEQTGGARAATSGAGGAPATAPAGSTQGSGVPIEWEVPGTERKLLSGADPVISASPNMLPIEAVIAFTVQPSGLVTGIETRRSSGYPEVDEAFRAAVGRYRFESAPGPAIKGSRRFVVRSLAR